MTLINKCLNIDLTLNTLWYNILQHRYIILITMQFLKGTGADCEDVDNEMIQIHFITNTDRKVLSGVAFWPCMELLIMARTELENIIIYWYTTCKTGVPQSKIHFSRQTFPRLNEDKLSAPPYMRRRVRRSSFASSQNSQEHATCNHGNTLLYSSPSIPSTVRANSQNFLFAFFKFLGITLPVYSTCLQITY